jgi:pyruvate-formate lyase
MQNRIARLKKKISEEKRIVSIDQARIITRIFKKTEGEPRAIQRAKSFRACCKELPLAIDPDELIVGNGTHGRRAGVIFPEAGISWLEKEIKNLPCREQTVLKSERDWLAKSGACCQDFLVQIQVNGILPIYRLETDWLKLPTIKLLPGLKHRLQVAS